MAVVPIERLVPALPVADIEAATEFALNEKAPATRRAYRSGFAAFRSWCASKGIDAVSVAMSPPAPVRFSTTNC